MTLEPRPAVHSFDAVMAEIINGVALLHSGDRSGGKGRLTEIWSRIKHAPKPFHECVLAHYLADAQDQATDELAWDHRALDAALRCPESEARSYHATLSIAAFMPSLYLNLAQGYRKVGNFDRMKDHLIEAQRFLDKLPDDSYGRMIRSGIEHLATLGSEQPDT